MTPGSRTYTFEARLPDIKQMMSMSGLDYLRGILTGDFPAASIAATLNFYPAELDHAAGTLYAHGHTTCLVLTPR